MYWLLFWFAVSNLFYLALHTFPSGSSYPKPLSAKEEKECLLAIRDGDKHAREKLILHNLRLVAHIIKRYHGGKDQGEDLMSIGTIGLIKASTTFNCEKGTRFATYASRCIENEILMHFRQQRKHANDLPLSGPIDNEGDGGAPTIADTIATGDDICAQTELLLKSEKMYRFIKE